MRARLAILVSGIQVELREVVLRNKPPELLAASPKGTVPVLVTVDGQVIDQSLDIMLWALRQNDPDGWLQPEYGSLDDVWAQIARWDGDFKHHLDRYKYPQRFDGADNGADSAVSLTVCSAFIRELEIKLTSNKYLFSSKLSILDAGLMPFVRQFSRVDAIWFAAQPWPYVQAWLAKLEASDAFAKVMQAWPTWAVDQETVNFP